MNGFGIVNLTKLINKLMTEQTGCIIYPLITFQNFIPLENVEQLLLKICQNRYRLRIWNGNISENLDLVKQMTKEKDHLIIVHLTQGCQLLRIAWCDEPKHEKR